MLDQSEGLYAMTYLSRRGKEPLPLVFATITFCLTMGDLLPSLLIVASAKP